MSLPVDAAVYGEHSDSMKKMQPNWNIRIFNRIEVQEGSSIRLNQYSGVITLGPGIYHITASSQVTYNDPNPPAEGSSAAAGTLAGYCRLRYTRDPQSSLNDRAVAIGTISNATMVPSLIDTYLRVDHQEEIVLEHQVGEQVDGVYLQDNTNQSSWHVFARIAIKRA
jgi:hypothetical protein